MFVEVPQLIKRGGRQTGTSRGVSLGFVGFTWDFWDETNIAPETLGLEDESPSFWGPPADSLGECNLWASSYIMPGKLRGEQFTLRIE